MKGGQLHITYSYVAINSAQILSGPSCRVYQREKCYSHCTDLSWTAEKYSGMHFWARGYFVSTVGADEEVVRVYIKEQEKEDHRVEQLSLFKQS